MKILGDDYETEAANWLADQPTLKLIARNFRAKTGEIDIVARDGAYLVFIEVRARNNPRYASAAASVDRRKQQRLLRTAQVYLQRRPEFANLPCRFDVIAFEPPQSGAGSRIRWIRSAFTA